MLKFYLRGLGIGMALTAVILHFSVYNTEHALTDEEIMERAGRLGMVSHITLSENETLYNEGENPAEVLYDGTGTSDIPESPDDGQSTGNPDDSSVPGEPEGSEGTEEPLPVNPSDEDNTDENTPEENSSDENTTNDNPSVTANPPVNPAEEDYVPGNGQNEDNDITLSEEQSEGMGGAGEMGDSIIIVVTGGDSSVSVAAKLAQAGLVSSAAAYDSFLCDNGYDKRISTGTHVIPIGASEREIAEILITRQ